MLRSQLIEILNVPHTGKELFDSSGLGGENATPPVSTRLRPCWTAFLSIRVVCY